MVNTMATPAEETAFPRGGKQVLTPLERKRLREEAKLEAEQDFAASAPRKKNRSSALAEVRRTRPPGALSGSLCL